MSDSESDGSVTSFSDTGSEMEVGYLKRKPKRVVNKTPDHFLGVHQRLWMLFVLLSSATAVTMLCILGDVKKIDTDYWKADEVIPDLFIGDYKDSLNEHQMKRLGITHVLTIILGVEPQYLDSFTYMTVRAQDHHSQDLLSYLEPMHKFIDEGRQKGRILVHCRAGQSRSAMVVASYLMREKRWNTYEALEHLKSVRPKISPRRGFVDQLEAYNMYKRDLSNVDLQKYTRNYPNKAQVTIYPSPGSSDSPQVVPKPEWIEENIWRENWDAIVHIFLHFYNRYLRYYIKE